MDWSIFPFPSVSFLFFHNKLANAGKWHEQKRYSVLSSYMSVRTSWFSFCIQRKFWFALKACPVRVVTTSFYLVVDVMCCRGLSCVFPKFLHWNLTLSVIAFGVGAFVAFLELKEIMRVRFSWRDYCLQEEDPRAPSVFHEDIVRMQKSASQGKSLHQNLTIGHPDFRLTASRATRKCISIA